MLLAQQTSAHIYIQRSFVLTHEAQHLLFIKLGPPLALGFSSLALVFSSLASLLLSLETLWSILLLEILYWSWTLLHSTSIRKILMVSQGRCVVGWKAVIGLEVVAYVSIHLPSFLNLIGTLMSKSLIIYAFMLTFFHSSHFMC